MTKLFLFKFLTILFLFYPTFTFAIDATLHKGGVFVKEITKDDHHVGFTYKNSKVLTYQKGNKYYLIFGIPFESPLGKNKILLKNGENDYPIVFEVAEKKYNIQRIKVNTKYTQPSDDVIKRIISENKKLNKVRNKWVNIKNDFNFISPVDGIITGIFGTRRFYNGIEGKYHNGLDIAAPIGTDISSPSTGKVLLVGDYFYNGKFIYLDHGQNLKRIFIHLNEILVDVGDEVEKGQIIGRVGSTGKSTGPHLHWSVTLNSVYIDPEIFINQEIF